ncbi:hypothetical protein [Thiothrix nivea]|uniref:hypothetical protein n=1 Tax=Thiothrix nivea TaxID=1031 RepID=UPI0002D530FB|nr:hypothetical protein [Thiothrix nivea]
MNAYRFGHVAVVVNVDLDKGEVALAEENYNNKPWPASTDYSRKIQIFNISGRYRLLDVETLQNKNIEGGLIAGWVYPLLNK